MAAVNIRFTTDGLVGNQPEVDWPEDWPPPTVGDEVKIRVAGRDKSLFVRVVQWCPQGTGRDPEPYIYIVLGPLTRRGA